MVAQDVRRLLSLVFIAVVALVPTSHAAPLPNDPLTVTDPTFPFTTHPLEPNASFWGSTVRPLPTNAWWENLVLDIGEQVIAPLPYQVVARPQGLAISFPWMVVTETFILGPFIENMRVQMMEEAESRKVVGYDDLSVTMQWRKLGGGGSMTMPILRGSPYMTFICDDITPMFSTVHAIVDISSSQQTGTRFEVRMNNGQMWLIWTSSPITLDVNAAGITPTAPFSGVIRVAIVPPGEKLPFEDLTPNEIFVPFLDDNHDIYPTGGSVVLAKDAADRGSLTFQFETESMSGAFTGDLLMMALPHHVDGGVQTAGMGNVFRTTYGFMTGVLGKQWEIEEALPTMTWTARPIDPSMREAVREALMSDKDTVRPTAADPYFFGKQIAAMGRLALIADELGETGIASDIREAMKTFLDPWLTSDNPDRLMYDSLWGGIVPIEGLMDSGRDFGAGYYNDHHFHYGYHIYAAAALGKEDADWLAANRQRLLDIVRDFANPNKNDPFFTYARHKDLYAGHSWATGLVNFGERANQESTSEAINSYYGVYLLGTALGETDLADFGQIMLATEIRSSAKYWQITSQDEVYPSPFADNKVVGIRWVTKADYATFFGARPELIHGIQYLPFTPISELHLRQAWLEEAYPVVSTALDDPETGSGWRGFIYMVHAVLDRDAAFTEITEELSGPYDDGNSKTNALYWVATRPLNGSPSPSPTTPSPSPTPTPSPNPTDPPSEPSPPAPLPPSDGSELREHELVFAQYILDNVERMLEPLLASSSRSLLAASAGNFGGADVGEAGQTVGAFVAMMRSKVREREN